MWDKETRKLWNRDYFNKRYHEFRQRMLDYLGGACVVCGVRENLSIHHKNPDEKEFNATQQWGKPWAKTLLELDKCELRCLEHHREAHAPKHGTPSCYKNRKCRCRLCVKANSAAAKVYKATYQAKLKQLGVKRLSDL